MADVAHSPGFLKLVESVRPSVREVDVAEAQRRAARGAILVDVREDREWEAGHARGAMHVGKGVIERDIEQKIPDTDAEVILYCGGGFRSVLAADSLRKMGYGNVASMAGGWRAWEAAGGETESGNS
jgi:rhodanese-related sulfurtransferase